MYLVLLLFSVTISRCQEITERPRFRVVAPQYICPKDEKTPPSEPDETVIRIQTAPGETSTITWKVRWVWVQHSDQRTTLLIWRAVRQMEKALNNRSKEPYTYVIDNTQLLPGISYIFNVSALDEGEESFIKSFKIEFVDGRRKLDLQEQVTDNKFSLVLLGSEETYAHLDYTIEAQVTTCVSTEDYYFVWIVTEEGGSAIEGFEDIKGSILTINTGLLIGGKSYSIRCSIYRKSDKIFITEDMLFLSVLRRGVEVVFDEDVLVIGVHTPINLHVELYNHDNIPSPFTYEWSCKTDGGLCNSAETVEDGTAYFASSFRETGSYEISVLVSNDEAITSANMTVIVVDGILPVIQVSPLRRLLNEGSSVTLVANVSKVAPTCAMTWYFATSDYTAIYNGNPDENCTDCKHGTALSETLTVYSLEETFLNELSDFSNETQSVVITATIPAAKGRARAVAKCGCSATFSCETEGEVYADVHFELNRSPKPGKIFVSPPEGVALETKFRISTLPVLDGYQPVRYSFWYLLDEQLVPLGAHLNYVAVETILPYIEDGVSVLAETCDAWGACASSDLLVVPVSPGTVNLTSLCETAQAKFSRCELSGFTSFVVSGLLTLKNTESEDLKKFELFIQDLIKNEMDSCVTNNSVQFKALISLLKAAGVEVNNK